MLIEILIWVVLIILAVLLLWMIINFKSGGGSGSFAAYSVMSEWQNEDKRNAMETIIEEQAGNIKHEDESGEKEKLE
jgi:hypothetical protein